MSDYQQVTAELAKGAQPATLCATCPWTRPCISPPQITTGDLADTITKAAEKDKEKLSDDPSAMPAYSLMTMLVLGGRDTSAQVCPVYALRLKSSEGRKIADSVRAQMQGWDDNA